MFYGLDYILPGNFILSVIFVKYFFFRIRATVFKSQPSLTQVLNMAFKKAFTLIEVMIVVAIIAILALVAVAQYTQYIERARASATLTLLQNLALAQFATQVSPYDAAIGFQEINGVAPNALNGINELAEFGFRPDSQVGFVSLSPVTVTEDDFIIFASYITVGAPVFIYCSSTITGVQKYDPASVYSAVLPARLYIYSWQAAVGPAAVGHLTIDPAGGAVSAVTIY